MPKNLLMADGSSVTCNFAGRDDKEDVVWVEPVEQVDLLSASLIFGDVNKTSRLEIEGRGVIYEGYTKLFYISDVPGHLLIGLEKPKKE